MEVLLWLFAVVALFAVVVGPMVAVVGLLVGSGCSGSATVCRCSARCLSVTNHVESSSPADSVSAAASTNVVNGPPG